MDEISPFIDEMHSKFNLNLSTLESMISQNTSFGYYLRNNLYIHKEIILTTLEVL